jgi:hypothetical protein
MCACEVFSKKYWVDAELGHWRLYQRTVTDHNIAQPWNAQPQNLIHDTRLWEINGITVTMSCLCLGHASETAQPSAPKTKQQSAPSTCTTRFCAPTIVAAQHRCLSSQCGSPRHWTRRCTDTQSCWRGFRALCFEPCERNVHVGKAWVPANAIPNRDTSRRCTRLLWERSRALRWCISSYVSCIWRSVILWGVHDIFVCMYVCMYVWVNAIMWVCICALIIYSLRGSTAPRRV